MLNHCGAECLNVVRIGSASSSRIHCREIEVADIDRLVDLLTKGFHPCRRDDWLQRLRRLSEHPTPPGFPKYGYLLECKGTLVGVSLMIYSSIPLNGDARIRCNDSGWYVEPAFRSYASMLASRGRGYKNVTYFNVTPDHHTLPILEAKGYVRYCSGWFAALPTLSAASFSARVKLVTAAEPPDRNLPAAEIELLSAHAGYGCISVTCSSEDGTYPFVFVWRKKLGFIPYLRLIYCRDVADFVRFAKPLGQFLAKRHFLLVVLDSNGPISGLAGAFFRGRPKYFRGPDQPRLGDLAYSELAMFPRMGERTAGEILVKRLSRLLYRLQNGRNRVTVATNSDDQHPVVRSCPTFEESLKTAITNTRPLEAGNPEGVKPAPNKQLFN
jgi:hypothetical protein